MVATALLLLGQAITRPTDTGPGMPRWVFALKLESTVEARGFGGGGMGPQGTAGGGTDARPSESPQPARASAFLPIPVAGKYDYAYGETLPASFIEGSDADTLGARFSATEGNGRIVYTLDQTNRIAQVTAETTVAGDGKSAWQKAYDGVRRASGAPLRSRVDRMHRRVEAQWRKGLAYQMLYMSFAGPAPRLGTEISINSI